MDYLTTLKVFCTVVEAKSFTRAADILGVSPPVVSRAISTLEQRLGSRLFNRTTRQISLTETAEQFFTGCSRLLDELDALEERATTRAVEATGVLRLVAHTTAAVNRLVPLMATFKRRHPQVRLEVTLTERPVDLVAEGYDLGVVVPFMLTSDTTVTRLLERIPLVIVATPAYLEQHSKPRHPSELVDHAFVAVSPSIRKPALTFRIGGDDVTVPLTYEVSSNSPVFNREMVLQGFGIGVLPASLVQNEIAAGQLVQLLDAFDLVEGAVEIRLAYTTRALLPAKVRAFVEHATEFFAQPADARHPEQAGS
ncbi:Transcriptional regulator [Caballeronia glathei]|jgi:DNA-binding transcriptional LysR family regulator|uniref:LysR family transcriptional regulator n=1 Tax=Caballeronia glathei TaxID=60547 RepID=A0A069PS59_9BURK|nr:MULTISPECIES: LysR family transcriptional regulator [Burkholderiaceae]KDR43573.1 LysR family transcriptional regulator [Caballeronia glathei]TCK39183.1 LysR family transcriptional regulator [Paraburkholderia sp. BL8N3]CDY75286.1 Transcriptional regulator [Caballeronia glathei]